MKNTFFALILMFLTPIWAFSQNESAVRMAEIETNTYNTEKVIENSAAQFFIQPQPPISVKQIEPLKFSKKLTNEKILVKPAISGKFLAKIKKNLKHQKPEQTHKTTKGGKFWAILFGLVSIVTFLLLFSEQSWAYWFISMISMTIALLINSDVAEILAIISCIVCLVLIIIGLTTANAMALLLGLLMLIYVAAMIGLT
ncbi:hypothetical protein [Raineya sp.]